jgi:GTP-binding protein EngB required for normal cell division
MPSDNELALQLKIALLGRSGIGKTSLVTAMLDQGRKLLAEAKEPLTIEPLDHLTEAWS